MNTKEPNIAIVLVNWNGTQDTLECLASLKNITYPSFDCIVVDNASSDNPGSIIKQAFPEIIYLGLNTNRGFAGGNNIAIDFAIQQQYEFVLLLNNDTIVDPNFLAPLLNCLQSNKTLLAVQPVIYNYYDQRSIWSAGGSWCHWLGDSFTIKQIDATKKLVYRDWLTGCAILIRTSALINSGLFNEKLFAYYEDVDLCMRLNRKGNELALVPTSCVFHKISASVNAIVPNKEGKLNPLVHFWNARNRLWLVKKYEPWYRYPTIFLAILFYYSFLMSYLVFRGRMHKCKMVIMGLWQGCTQSMD